MKNQPELAPCARAEDVLDYLYGEASADEKRNVEQHLAICAACAKELASFQAVRQDLGLWREEILHTAPARVVNARPFASERPPERSLRTVLVLLKDLFTFSPLWLRGATALASFAFVGLMVFALSNLGRQNSAPAPPVLANNGPTETEIQQRMSAAVQSEREKLAAQYEQELAALKEQNAGDSQRINELQAKLDQARADVPVTNAPAPRIIKVYVPQTSGAKRNSGTVAKTRKNQPRRVSPLTPDDEEIAEDSLADVMFGGAGRR